MKNSFSTITKVLKNGMRLVLLKNKQPTKTAAVIVPIGNNAYPGKIAGYDVPSGIAHFFEHRIFDTKKGDALDLFDELGLFANAETSYDYTSYYFSGTSHFEEGLKVLLDMINNRTFSPVSVKKEKPIILEEMNGELAEPSSLVLHNLMTCLFNESPFKDYIIGTSSSVKKTSFADLKRFYETFYHPRHLTLVLVGDIDESIVDRINRKLRKPTSEGLSFVSTRKSEQEEIVSKEKSVTFPVTIPYFAVGYKFTKTDRTAFKMTTYDFATFIDLMCDFLFDNVSHLENYLNDSAYRQVKVSSFCGNTDDTYYICLMGNHRQYQGLITLLRNYIGEIDHLIDEKTFEALKKGKLGDWLRRMNHNDALLDSYIDYKDLKSRFTQGETNVANMTYQDAQRFVALLQEKEMAVSIVKKD